MFRQTENTDTFELDRSRPRTAMLWRGSGKLGWHDYPVSPSAYYLTYPQMLLAASFVFVILNEGNKYLAPFAEIPLLAQQVA